MALSAVAARLAAAAQQQAEQPNQNIPIATSANASPSSSSSETRNHPRSCEDGETQLNKPISSRAQAQSSQPNIQAKLPASNPAQDPTMNYLAPQKNFKPRRDSPRSSFIDQQCVSNWQPVYEGPHQNVTKVVDQNHPQSNLWTLGLHHGQTLICHGTLRLSVLSGAVDLMGSELVAPSPQPIQVFAPPSHPLPTITAKDSQTSRASIEVPHLDPAKFSTIIQLNDFHCGIHQLDGVWSSNGNKPSIWSRSSRTHPIQGQTWSLLLSPMPDLAHLQVLPSWSFSLSDLPTTESAGIYLIEGPKGSGKSTFSTLLINTLLNTFKTVALLDLDPGQPLLTPPTLLSLHTLTSPILGPSFCRLVSPHHSDSRSIYIGHTTPKDCPHRYVQASLELFNVYLNLQPSLTGSVSTNKRLRRRPTYQPTSLVDSRRTDQIPLVINTMGWTRGLGQELLNQICETIQPNRIFSFSDYPVITALTEPSERHTRLEPIGSTPLSLRLTPADCRMLTIVSYMHSSPARSGGFFVEQWDFQHPLWARRPFEVRPGGVSLPDHPGFDRAHLGHVMNGGMVGLVDGSSRWWVGFALVRAIHPARKSLLLLTPAYPTPDHPLNLVQFVKHSEPEVPVICSIGPGPVPYLEKEALAPPTARNSPDGPHLNIRFAKKRVRRNVQRRSQIAR